MVENDLKTIYVRLLDGTEAFVPVPAIVRGGGIFEITENPLLDPDDFTAIWEYFPGDSVLCERRNDMLLAVRLVSSTVSNRHVYDLVFRIVESLGRLVLPDTTRRAVLNDLCSSASSVGQIQHPLVQKWITNAKKES